MGGQIVLSPIAIPPVPVGEDGPERIEEIIDFDVRFVGLKVERLQVLVQALKEVVSHRDPEGLVAKQVNFDPSL